MCLTRGLVGGDPSLADVSLAGRRSCLSQQVLVDGPISVTGIHRQVMTLKRITLTDLKVDVQRNARQGTIAAAWAKGETMKKWAASSWAKKLARQATRASLSDMDRFKVMLGRKKVRGGSDCVGIFACIGGAGWVGGIEGPDGPLGSVLGDGPVGSPRCLVYGGFRRDWHLRGAVVVFLFFSSSEHAVVFA